MMAMKIESQENFFQCQSLCHSQEDCTPVYDNISTVPTTPGPSQRVTADHDNNDDIQYANIQLKPKKVQQEVLSQEVEEEEVQYASVQFKKQKPAPLQEESQKASVDLKGPSAATQ